MSYTRILAIVVAVAIGVLGAIQIADTHLLGLSDRIVAWLAIGATGLGILQGFLPPVQKGAEQPEDLAERVMALSETDRKVLQLLVDEQHRAEAGGAQ